MRSPESVACSTRSLLVPLPAISSPFEGGGVEPGWLIAF